MTQMVGFLNKILKALHLLSPVNLTQQQLVNRAKQSNKT